MALTDKQEQFIQNLVKGMSQREAYRIAFPKCRSADKTIDETASKLFHTPKVHARYEEIHTRLVKESEDECIVSVKDVLRELVKIGFANITDFVTTDGRSVEIKKTSDIDKDKLGAIAGIKEGVNGIEIKFNDKEKALEMIGRHLGMWNDKVDLTGNISVSNPYQGLSTEELKKLINDG